MGENPLRIRFEKVDGFIKIQDGTRYLVLFSTGCYDAIDNRIRYLISEKTAITDTINHNFARTRIDLYNSLTIEKILTFHDVIILIKSVVQKNKNNYDDNIYLEKGLYEDKSYTRFFLNGCLYIINTIFRQN